MSGNTTRRALEILDRALEFEGAERSTLIEEACRGDPELKREVEACLRHHVDDTITPASEDSVPMPELPIRRDFAERYELGDEIARGGVGRILRAEDRELGRVVAIKILLPDHRRTPNVLLRFVSEAKISARLAHPGIPPVYEMGRLASGDVFIAMKLIEGRTLSSLLQQRVEPTQDLPRFLRIFEQICQTIAYAHSQGIIHRDLKPDNVMVSRFGEVQVMDWGLAKSTSEEPPRLAANQEEVTSTTRRSGTETRVGAILGTPAYMPPEQSIGLPQTQSDVFALGGVLCEILTGAPPYPGPSSTMQLDRATRADLQDAYGRLERCDADPELVKLARDCLQPESEKRPGDAGAVAHRMSDHLRSAQQRVRQAEMAAENARTVAEQRRRRARLRLIATVLGFSVILVLLGGLIVNSRQREQYAEKIGRVEAEEREAAEAVSYWATMLAAFREYRTGHNFEADQILEASPPGRRNWEWHYLRNLIAGHAWKTSLTGSTIRLATIPEGGSELALIDDSSVVRLMDIPTKTVVDTVIGPPGPAVAISGDGHYVLSAIASPEAGMGEDSRVAGTLILWKTLTGTRVQEFDPFPYPLDDRRQNQHTISPHGRYVACTSPDRTEVAIVYETASGKPIRSFRTGDLGCTFSPDGEWFVFCNQEDDGGIHFWDVAEDREARPPITSAARVLRLSPDGSRLACVDHGGIEIWDLREDESFFLEMESVRFPNGTATFSEDGKTFVAAFNHDSLRVWNAETGALLRSVGSIGLLAAGQLGAHSWHQGMLTVCESVDLDTHVTRWNLQSQSPYELRGHKSFVYPVAINSDGSRIVSGAWDETVKVWDGDTGRLLFTCEGHTLFVHDLDLDEREQRIVSVDSESTIYLWDAKTGNLLLTRRDPFAEPLHSNKKHVAFTADGRSVVGNSDTHLLVMDSSTLEVQRSVELETVLGNGFVTDLKTSPTGRYLALIGRDRTTTHIKIFSLETLEETRSFVHQGTAMQVAFSPDEATLAVGFLEGSVAVWEVHHPEQALWLKTFHQSEIYALAFTPDGTRLFSGGRDATIRVWDPGDGTSFGPLRGHANYVYSLAISGDGKRLVSGSGDGTVRIWETWPYSRRAEAIGWDTAASP